MVQEQYIALIEDFKLAEDEPIRKLKRPADSGILFEVSSAIRGERRYQDLQHFWLAALLSFVEDSGSERFWFEGLAYQSLFSEIDYSTYRSEFRLLQSLLILPPAEVVELSRCYRVLSGRLRAYAGITPEGDYWAGIFGPSYYDAQ